LQFSVTLSHSLVSFSAYIWIFSWFYLFLFYLLNNTLLLFCHTFPSHIWFIIFYYFLNKSSSCNFRSHFHILSTLRSLTPNFFWRSLALSLSLACARARAHTNAFSPTRRSLKSKYDDLHMSSAMQVVYEQKADTCVLLLIRHVCPPPHMSHISKCRLPCR